jgi:hypothetical protein
VRLLASSCVEALHWVVGVGVQGCTQVGMVGSGRGCNRRREPWVGELLGAMGLAGHVGSGGGGGVLVQGLSLWEPAGSCLHVGGQ